LARALADPRSAVDERHLPEARRAVVGPYLRAAPPSSSGRCLAPPSSSAFTPLVQRTPRLVGAVVAVLIGVTGPWTGGSFNPARQFGPALLSSQTAFLWSYLVAALTGAVSTAAAYRLIGTRRVLTRQLCGS
jgi:uncharacterized membrane protein YeaQ/YmgE (transglycosylase-associated protein family)